MSHERINPFDKNNTSYEPSIYSSLSSSSTSTAATSSVASPSISSAKEDTKSLDDLTKDRFNRQQGVRDQQTGRYTAPQETKPVTSSVTSSIVGTGFDYSYSPASIPSSKKDRTDSTESDAVFTEKPISSGKKHEFKRELSDADIIFGGQETTKPFTANRFATYNKTNSTFSTSVSSESDYIYGAKGKESSFSKSLSVSSDKDGDFSHDPSVISSRNYQGITNDAFSDFDSPKSTPSARKWTDDDDFDLK